MGFLAKLFGREEKLLEAADISTLQVDIHSHLIPGIDDGAATLEESMVMLRKFKGLGYRKVITTPHVMSDFYKNDSDTILRGLELLRGAARAERLDIEVDAAAEYYLDDAFEGMIERKDFLTFGDNHVLFELPFIGEPINMSRAIFNLQLGGYKPVLAHPERYAYWLRDMDKYAELTDKGVLLQVNINSLSGYYGPEAKKTAEYLVEHDLVSLLGTDCHRSDHLEVYESISCRTPSFHKLLDGGRLINSRL